MTTLTKTDLRALGYEVRDGVAVKVTDGGGLAYRRAKMQAPDGTSNPASREATAGVGLADQVGSLPTVTRYRSKWEAEYAERLDQYKRAGSLRDWRYEAIRLRLAEGAYYKPDFMIQRNDGRIELHEVKGHWREAAKVRWKVARDQYPMFRMFIVTKRNGRWIETDA